MQQQQQQQQYQQQQVMCRPSQPCRVRCVGSRAQRMHAAVWIAWLVILHVLQHAGTGAAAAETTGAAAETTGGQQTRFYIDEGYFLEGDTEILRAYIAASGGRMTISGESSAAFLSVKGYYVPDTWDVYWTIRQACHMAYKHMQPHQMVNCIPGISAMALKRTFVSTWQQAYGERAFNYIPRSYLIPQQYWLWRSHLLATGSPPDRKWVLKANIHRGKGVSVLPQHEAISHALTHKHEPHISTGADGAGSDSDSSMHYLNVLVQSYLQQQLVIAGRSSYIRVWLLVTSINPLRAYLFNGGFAIFGKQKGPSAASAASNNKTSSSDELIVNLWIQDRNSSPIWSLQHLKQYLDGHPNVVLPLTDTQQQQQQAQTASQSSTGRRHILQANTTATSSSTGTHTDQQGRQQQQQGQRLRTFADAWQDMQTSASLVLAAALPAMRAAAAEAKAPGQGTFEYFGLDFVFDAHLRPWMLEVNAIPSMARRKRSDCAGEAATASCKLTTTGAAGGSSSSAAGSAAAAAASVSDDFDAQKEQFMHDMLVLLGLPVDNNTAGSSTAALQADSAQQAAAANSAGVLLMAAAAAAGIRSTPAAAAAATKKGSSSSSSNGSNPSSSSTNTDRRLLSATALQSGDTLKGTAGVQRVLPAWQPLQRPQRQLLQPGLHAREGGTPAEPAGRETDTAQPASKSTGFMGVAGLQWSGPAPDIKQLPTQLQQLLCAQTGPGTDGSASSRTNSTQFACISCLTADDLAALAAAEGELQRAGRFVPVHDLIAAHHANKAAFKDASTGAAAGNISSSTVAANSAASNTGSSTPAAPASKVAGASPGSLYLSQSRSVWQKLFGAWKGVSQGGVGVRDLGVMKYYTTASTLSAEKHLDLQRLDYVMSAWLRVRREASCDGLQVADCVVKRLGLLVSRCYL